MCFVALLAEGVDRNRRNFVAQNVEIRVALLAEGVDRNTMKEVSTISKRSRPPRGGRG